MKKTCYNIVYHLFLTLRVEKLWPMWFTRLYTYFCFFALWAYLLVTDQLTELLEVCACWCSWGDSVVHEWLRLQQREEEREPAAGVQWITMYSQSGGVMALCFSRDPHSLQDCKAASNIFLLFFIWLAFCNLGWKNTRQQSWRMLYSFVYIIHTTFCAVDPFWLTKKTRSYFITCVKVCMLGFWADFLSNTVCCP